MDLAVKLYLPYVSVGGCLHMCLPVWPGRYWHACKRAAIFPRIFLSESAAERGRPLPRILQVPGRAAETA